MKYFFDIPVYRVSQEQYYAEQDAYVERTMYPGPPSWNEEMRKFHEQYPDRKQNLDDHLRSTYGGAWVYNEIVGWIQLHFLGSQLRGEFWRVRSKRIVRSRKKVFEYQTWKLAPEVEIPPDANSADIYDLIKEYLSDCKHELKGRYLDTSRLDVIGPHVDWLTLIEATNV